MTIAEILGGVGYPVCHPPYRGSESRYITYQLIGQTGMLYADNGEANTGVLYSVHLWAADGRGLYEMMHKVRSRLEDADWVVTVDTQFYDNDARLHRLILNAVAVGAIYG